MKRFISLFLRFIPNYMRSVVGVLVFSLISTILSLFSFAMIVPILELLFGISSPLHEAPVYDEQTLTDIKAKGININHVITHTCPSFCDPTHKDGINYWLQKDPGLDEVIDNERKVMDQLYNKLIEDGHNLKTWTYGHYHRHNNQMYNDIKFTMLGAILNSWDNPDWIEIRD